MTASEKQPRDIRMRGFAQRSSVDEALAWVDAASKVLGPEDITLNDACGRVLANAVTAPMSVPPFERSAMDGYAVIADETTGATDYNPLPFEVIGTSMPGHAFEGSLASGQAVRIMTGAPIPDGCTGVVPVEYTSAEGTRVNVTLPIPHGKHVGRVGEDIAEGTEVLPAGRVLRPQDLGVLASLGMDRVTVVRRPQVRIITTGNELAVPGSPREEHQIYDANTSILTALVSRDDAVLESARRVEDSEDAIRDALTDGDVDVVLVGGGSSVGAEDFAPQIVAEEGELPIHGVAMRPSSPSGMGRVGEKLVFLLPGNPVSCLCAYDFFAGRCIRQLGGRNAEWPYAKTTAKLVRKISSVVGRLDYCRVLLDGDQCEPIAISGASILSSTTRADGFVIVPPGSEGYPEGSDIVVYRYARAEANFEPTAGSAQS